MKKDAVLINVSLAELAIALWQRRRALILITSAGLLLATGIALIIPNEYSSIAQLMPPDPQSLSTVSMLNTLGAGSILPGMQGGLLATRTPGATTIGILNSRTVQDDIVNLFDLRRIYRCKLGLDARIELSKRTNIVEDKKSGIISITVTDRDPYRAQKIVAAYVNELDKLVNSLSTSSARRERVFLEERLISIKSELDKSSRALSEFSSRNATLDYQKQGEATVEAAARLQGQLIAAESELSGLKAEYADDNVRVRTSRARIGELQSQLRKMAGEGEHIDGADLRDEQLFPSVRKLPLLGLTYVDLYRQMTMQESLYEAMTKQYEFAKVQEAKEIPPIKMLDAPELPERKASPHRSVIVLLGAVAAALAGTVWIVGRKLYDIAHGADSARAKGEKSPWAIRAGGASSPL